MLVFSLAPTVTNISHLKFLHIFLKMLTSEMLSEMLQIEVSKLICGSITVCRTIAPSMGPRAHTNHRERTKDNITKISEIKYWYSTMKVNRI